MASTQTQTLEVALSGGSIAIRMTNGAVGAVGQWEYYPLCNVISITGNPQLGYAVRNAQNQLSHRYPHDDMLQVVVELKGEQQVPIRFDIQDVTNQAGWTADPAGLAQAILDIKTWVEDCCCGAGSGGATAVLQQATIDAIVEHQDFEEILVIDTGDSDALVSRRTEYDESTDSYSFTYHNADGSTHTVIGPLVYPDPATTPASVETPSIDTITAAGAGSVVAGAKSITITNSGPVDITVDGDTLTPGESVGWTVSGPSATLAAVSYSLPGVGSPEMKIIKTV